MPFRIIRDDITHVRADAIVNTANPRPAIGSGTDYAVYQAAGAEVLLEDRKKIGRIPPGEVAVTGAHALHARYILHTVGPFWDGPGNTGETDCPAASETSKALLASCYRKSLLLAQQLGCESIAFPLISSGNYRYPKEEALRIALDTIRSFLQDSEMDVTLVVYDRNSYALSAGLTDHVDAFIDERYVEEKPQFYSSNQLFYNSAQPASGQEPKPGKAGRTSPFPGRKLKDLIGRKSETFQEQLLRLIDEKGYTDVEVYKRANLDRKLFSHIRSNKDYRPKKKTALALAIALELDLKTTEDLLSRAELALSPSSKSDLIISYFIQNGIYDIYEINAALFQYQQPTLGC